MKKLVFLSVMLLLGFTVAQANPLKGMKTTRHGENSVSDMSINSFRIDFGNMPNVHWKRGEDFDEASFIKGGKEMTAYFDVNGNLVGTTTHITYADIPAKGRERIKSEYPDYKINAVTLYNDNGANQSEMILYGIQFDSDNNYFVELSNGMRKIVLKISPEGDVSFFKELK
jgi:hypothetical protein